MKLLRNLRMGRTEMQSQKNHLTADKVYDARSGRSHHRPTGMGLSRQFREVHEWWLDSKLRLVAGELYRIFLRISAMWGDSFLRYGPAIPNDPRRTHRGSLAEENTFGSSCSEGIRQLSRKHEWMGPLDQQLAGEAFQLGFSSACRILAPCTKGDGSASAQS